MAALLGVGLATLAAPASAGAVTTIGSDLSTAPNGGTGCGFALGSCTVAQQSLPGRQVAAPFDGVVVRWRIRVGVNGTEQPVKLRVIRGTGPASTGAGTGDAATVPATPGTYTYDARLEIAEGDRVGVDCCVSDFTLYAFGSSGVSDDWRPALGDGESRAPSFTSMNLEVLVNADVEPDADDDGFGDETQDACLAQAGLANGCAPNTTIVKGPKDKTKNKRASFEFAAIARGAGSSFQCGLDGAPLAPCASPLTVRVKRGKHTFQVRAVDAGGNADPTPATDDWKVKKRKKR